MVSARIFIGKPLSLAVGKLYGNQVGALDAGSAPTEPRK